MGKPIECTDAVSREDALNCLNGAWGDYSVLNEVYERISKLPSVNPQPCDDAISRDAVIYYIKGHIHEIITESGTDKNAHTNSILRALINGVETMPSVTQKPIECDDAISRDFLFRVLDNFCGHDRTATITLDTLADIAYELPSVTQKSGKWIDYSDDGYVECPFCGHATTCEDNIDELHYCFYCGARMVEPQESEK